MPLTTPPVETLFVDVPFPVMPAGFSELDPHEQAAAQSEANRTALTFRFWTRPLAGARWDELERKFPPADPNRDDYDPTNFAPHVIAESVVDWCEFPANEPPDDSIEVGNREGPIDLEQAQELWQTWPAHARARLFRHVEIQNLIGGGLGKRPGPRNA